MDFDLYEILNSSSDNDVASLLLKHWNEIRTESLSAEEIYNMMMQPPLPSDESRDDDPKIFQSFWTNRDLRIKSMQVCNFRSFPPVADGEPSHGITLSPSIPEDYSSENPYSLVLLGNNGSGKTSLYSAIEYYCCGKTAIAEKHKIRDVEKLNKFYSHLQDTYSSKIAIQFVDDAVETNGVEIKSHIDLSPFFCSESDLSLFECSGRDIVEYFDKQIGLEELGFANKFILALIEKTTDAPSESEDDSDSSKELRSKKATLLNDINLKIEERILSKRNETLVNAQTILQRLLEDYEDSKVELDYILSNPEVSPTDTTDGNQRDSKKLFNGKLRIKGSSAKLDPREYFNNFRFKLYLISIRIAVAFHIMKQRKILFPLLFDDVFDSSDFKNRLQSEVFFRRIKQIYIDLKIGESPLQLLFFTQDEIIAESVFEGLTFDDKHDCLSESPTILGRLFSVFPESDITPNDKPIDLNDNIRFYNVYDIIRINV